MFIHLFRPSILVDRQPETGQCTVVLLGEIIRTKPKSKRTLDELTFVLRVDDKRDPYGSRDASHDEDGSGRQMHQKRVEMACSEPLTQSPIADQFASKLNNYCSIEDYCGRY
ncbi:hypothetical protein CBL_14660 [Carabus blaptoides fortunei]